MIRKDPRRSGLGSLIVATPARSPFAELFTLARTAVRSLQILRCCPDLLIRRSGQIVRGHPPPSGPSVKPREMVRVVALVPARVAVSVAVSPAHDCFFPKHGR